MNITKQNLVTDIAVATGITQKVTKQVVEAFLDFIELHLEKGNTVELRGFGRFSVKGRKSRPVRNPKTGAVLQLGDRMVPTVKFCDDLKERVNR